MTSLRINVFKNLFYSIKICEPSHDIACFHVTNVCHKLRAKEI